MSGTGRTRWATLPAGTKGDLMRFRTLLIGGGLSLALGTAGLPANAGLRVPELAPSPGVVVKAFHPGRATSFYCYPRAYWWFYRPYTTASDRHERCMPYFHYPQRPARAPELK